MGGVPVTQWRYAQDTGVLDLDGTVIAKGYSGHGDGKNNPHAQSIPNVGPIPCGLWRIVGPPQDTLDHGPYVLTLEALPFTETFGRSGFLMHGDSIEHPGEASRGCLIFSYGVREGVWMSGITELLVVATVPPELDEEPITPNVRNPQPKAGA